MTSEEVSSGLVLPYVSTAIAGKGGAGAVLVIVFMVRLPLSAMAQCSHSAGLYEYHFGSVDRYELDLLFRYIWNVHQQESNKPTDYQHVSCRSYWRSAAQLHTGYSVPRGWSGLELATLFLGNSHLVSTPLR